MSWEKHSENNTSCHGKYFAYFQSQYEYHSKPSWWNGLHSLSSTCHKSCFCPCLRSAIVEDIHSTHMSPTEQCWNNVGTMLEQCWNNVVTLLEECWTNVGPML